MKANLAQKQHLQYSHFHFNLIHLCVAARIMHSNAVGDARTVMRLYTSIKMCLFPERLSSCPLSMYRFRLRVIHFISIN